MIHLPKSPAVFTSMRRLPRMPTLCGEQVSSRSVTDVLDGVDCPVCIERERAQAVVVAPEPPVLPDPVSPSMELDASLEADGEGDGEDGGEALESRSRFVIPEPAVEILSGIVDLLPAAPEGTEAAYTAALERLESADRDALGAMMLALHLAKAVLPEPVRGMMPTLVAQVQAFVVRLMGAPEAAPSGSGVEDLRQQIAALAQRVQDQEAVGAALSLRLDGHDQAIGVGFSQALSEFTVSHTKAVEEEIATLDNHIRVQLDEIRGRLSELSASGQPADTAQASTSDGEPLPKPTRKTRPVDAQAPKADEGVESPV